MEKVAILAFVVKKKKKENLSPRLVQEVGVGRALPSTHVTRCPPALFARPPHREASLNMGPGTRAATSLENS